MYHGNLPNSATPSQNELFGKGLYFGYGPFPVTVTTRIITVLVGNPCKPLFATVTGKGPHTTYIINQHCSLVRPLSFTAFISGLDGEKDTPRTNIVAGSVSYMLGSQDKQVGGG